MNTSNCPSLPQRLLSRPQGRSYQASHRGAGDMVSPVSFPFAHQPALVFRVKWPQEAWVQREVKRLFQS